MATIKSFTSLEQSKKLTEILPLESADGGWYGTNNPLAANTEYWLYTKYTEKAALPAWSLAALLDVFPEYNLQRTDWENKTEYKIFVTINDDNYGSKNYDNPVDACVAMIEKLHELNLL